MCGIIGYIGKENAVPLVYEGLKKLEYRGYDSAGMAINKNGNIIIRKGVGKIEEVFDKSEILKMYANVGIAHSRWATHGNVTDENAHPHLSNNNEIVVVHNGIIENFDEVKSFLLERNFKLKSQTDTEVIPNLIQYFLDKGFALMDAVMAALKMLKGSFAVLILFKNKDILVGARKESPLVVGVGKDGYFLSSDIPSFLEHTKDVVYLHDGDIVLATPQKIKFFSLKTGLEVQRNVSTVDWDAEQAKKGSFEHFMLKEIFEQADAIKMATMQKKEQIESLANLMKKAKGVFLIGCGTSYHACLAASYKFAKVANFHVNVVVASEFENFSKFINDKSLIIAVSQSGETADVLNAVKLAREKGAKVFSIVNVVGSSLTRYSHQTILQNAGPEICVLATKSYTSQLAILTLIAYALAGKYDEGINKLRELVNYIYYLTSENMRNRIKELSEKLRYTEHIYLIGRSLQFPTALEAALKIKEVSYVHAEAFPGGELKHGPLALIEYGTPCIIFVSKDTEKEILSNAAELKARGAYIIGISYKNNDIFDFFIKVREAEELNTICQIIPIQILAYQLAILRGCDPDKPKNLAKSVTVK